MSRFRIRLSFLSVLALWLAVALPHTFRTPDPAFSHDFADHVQYTQLLHQLHRLPHPGEGGETHQPPLYYLIASQLGYAGARHVLYVRLFSVLLGALVLGMIHTALEALGVKTVPAALTLAFCATTPHFLFLFSSYNNDALMIFWGILYWAVFLSYLKNPSSRTALGLGGIALAGFLTKLSFGPAWLAVGTAALYLRVRGKLAARPFNQLAVVQGLALAGIAAWMFVHNYQASGQWHALTYLRVPWQRIPHSALQTILTPPGFTTWEWTTPFADAFLPIGKKNSLTAYLWTTAIFGEYSFSHLQDVWIWFIFWVQTVWLAAALAGIRRASHSAITSIALAVCWLALAAHVFRVPFGSAMDFRHVAWLWLPLTLLRAQALQIGAAKTGRALNGIAVGVILMAIAAQWGLILTV